VTQRARLAAAPTTFGDNKVEHGSRGEVTAASEEAGCEAGFAPCKDGFSVERNCGMAGCFVISPLWEAAMAGIKSTRQASDSAADGSFATVMGLRV
jgi:hypothetical protein